jgi:AbrB family looped-hinge helix DNA binding protein
MSEITTTKMTSKGQVVIPEAIRKKLGLKPGSQFVVIGGEGVVVLKQIEPLSMSLFDDLVGHARRQAHEAGLKRPDIREALAEVRAKR